MKVELDPGKYVVAVSGGVDSVVLLDLLRKDKGLDLVVAHFDHGIRKDSAEDAEFVGSLSKKYSLVYEAGKGNLGPKASEELARNKRYEFLYKIKAKNDAQAIITAHHEDDLIETAIINVLRGTGHKGLSSLSSRPGMIRPLLKYSKKNILDYAKKNNLKWREDPTNQETKYLRNYIRNNVLVNISESQKRKFLNSLEKSREKSKEIKDQIDQLAFNKELNRAGFNKLPYDVTREVLVSVLRAQNISFDAKTIERLSVQLKTSREGKKLDASNGWSFFVGKQTISLRRG